ncbi:MAG: hypothetical protein SFV24_10505 [Gemmatimonadales bacterium]|nr:hypothetical protein [Gemmatimonadales bacterium]
MELFILILLFVAGSLLQAAGKRKQNQGPPDTVDDGEAAEPDLMAEIRKAMEQLKEQREGRQPRQDLPGRRPPIGQFPARPLPTRRPAPEVFEDDEDVEEAVSLESEPVVESLETEVVRPEREVVDQDDQAEALLARRVKWAEDHGKRLSLADHRAFDKQIREAQPVVPDPAIARRNLIRQRMIWGEILGPPLALRPPREP